MTHAAFFGYPSKPELTREVMHTAVLRLSEASIETLSWEDLRVGGRLVITQVLDAIRDSHVAVFEVSTLNQNVLFEMGYAVALGKRIWLLLDRTDAEAKKRWRQFSLLGGVGMRDGLIPTTSLRHFSLSGPISRPARSMMI